MDVGSGGGSPSCAKRCCAQSMIRSMRGSPFQTAMSWAPGSRVPVRTIGGVVGGRMLSHHPLGRWPGVVQRRTESMRCSRSSRMIR